MLICYRSYRKLIHIFIPYIIFLSGCISGGGFDFANCSLLAGFFHGFSSHQAPLTPTSPFITSSPEFVKTFRCYALVFFQLSGSVHPSTALDIVSSLNYLQLNSIKVTCFLMRLTNILFFSHYCFYDIFMLRNKALVYLIGI